MKKSGKIFLHAEADRNCSPDVAQHWIFLYAELESVKSECDQAAPYGQLFLNLKKEKVTDMTFRFADENDCSVILTFIKALADYERMTDQVVATEELLKEWIFEKKKAEVFSYVKAKKKWGLRCSSTTSRHF